MTIGKICYIHKHNPLSFPKCKIFYFELSELPVVFTLIINLAGAAMTTTTKNQYTLQNPTTQYPAPKFKKQAQSEPGLAKDMKPKPDHGEDSYQGSGRLKGRKALVTGADSGIGRATAIAFAREGADIVLSYLPAEEADAADVVGLIKRAGRKAVTVPGDIADERFCRQLIETTVKQLGGIDILANIAGKQVAVEAIADLTTDQLDKTFRTNVYAMFWLCKYALPHLPAGASIINTASIQSYQPSAHLLDYASTKAAIVAFTKALAKQVADQGIRVNAVAPGPVWTPLQPSHGQPPEALPDFGAKTPMGRPGQPAEVAPAYVFFASPESSFVTAEVLGVTGGQHLP
jgi:NAD(P)-dependent dehydrogenase (short-subunit alcohol dehydrogenase family)